MTMKVRSLVLAALIVSAGSWLPAAVPPPPKLKVAVFVEASSRAGLDRVDKGVEDSVKDIQAEVRKSKAFALVASADDATVVIRILARHSPGTSHRAPFPVGPGMTMMMPVRRRAIDFLIRTGTSERDWSEREMTSEPEGDDRWKAAAKQVVKDVAEWISSNDPAVRP